MTKIYLDNLVRRNLELGWRACLALLLFTSIGVGSLSAQVSGYVFSQSTGSFNSVGGTVLGVATANSGAIPSLDTTSFPLTLPFAFNFNSQNYTDVNVSSNGYITFGTGSATGSSPISATTTYDGAISAWGRDINAVFDVVGKTGNIKWTTEGTAPNRVVVIQWENFRPTYSSSATAAYVFSFQIRLAETTNLISTVYSTGGYLIGTTTVSSTAQIGLRGATNTDFNNRLNPTTVLFDNSTVGTANSSSQAFSSAANPPGMPTEGLTYTWTPPTCLGPNTLTVSNITTTSADLAWNASISAPANGYDVYYSTSDLAPTSSSIPNFANVAGVTQSLTGLTPASTYYVWVRSVCSITDASNWIALPTFNTNCAPITDMFENFDSYGIGSIVPNCWDRIAGTGTQTISSTTPNSGSRNLYQYSSSAANQTIVVLPDFSNIIAGTHWLRFKARVTTAPRTIDIGYVTNATDASTFVIIESKSITNTAYTSLDSEYTIIVPTTLPPGARLAIRNPGTLATTFYFDDIYWEAAPTCLPPSDVVVSNTAPTSATVSWTASTTLPGNGYQVYYSTTNTPPTAATTPNISSITGTSTIISGLNPVTGYFVWVRSACSSSDISTWTSVASFTTSCQPPALLSTAGATVCPSATATLSATADPGAIVQWYDGTGTLLTTGNSYTTPPLTTTTTYFATAAVGSSNLPAGKATYGSGPTSGAGTTNFGLVFDVITPSTLTSVTIYPVSASSASGSVIIDVIDSNGNVLHSKTESVTGSPAGTPVAHIATLNFPLLPGTNYKIRPRSYTGISGLLFDPSATAPGGNYGYPFVLPGVLSINTSTLSAAPTNTVRNDLYYYFYDWKVSSQCESTQQPVVAIVDPVACLGTSETDGGKAINVYPNPFTDVINISDVKGLLSISVNDVSGRLVKTILKPSEKVYLGELKSGMYLLTLKYKDGISKTIKAIKK